MDWQARLQAYLAPRVAMVDEALARCLAYDLPLPRVPKPQSCAEC
ncbi:MAG: hypothetical protein ACK4NB_03595 [Fimbriimonadales bacterium]